MNAVDTEDVAMKANEIAPGRFSWKKYPDQINLELVRVFLSDAKKPANGSYVRGSGVQGWILTPQGLDFAKEVLPRLNTDDLSRAPMTPRDKHLFDRERLRLKDTTAYEKYVNGNGAQISRREVEQFFRLDDYIVGPARERKVDRITTMFRDDQELRDVTAFLRARVLEGGN